MTDTKDGGSAFPEPVHFGGIATLEGGLSKREWFAGMALQGMLFGSFDFEREEDVGKPYTVALAQAAFRLADAMLAASQPKGESDGK